MLISKGKQIHLRAFFRDKTIKTRKNNKNLWNKISELISKEQKGMKNI